MATTILPHVRNIGREDIVTREWYGKIDTIRKGRGFLLLITLEEMHVI